MNLIQQAHLAKQAFKQVKTLSLEIRNQILRDFTEFLKAQQESILLANSKDIDLAKNAGLSQALIDRLMLDEARLHDIIESVNTIIDLPDPIHQVLEQKVLESNILLEKVSVAMGVIGIIYESRPNVTADCAALCLKAGSCCVLKGGKESYHSSEAIVSCFKQALHKNHVSEEAVMLAQNPSHQETQAFMECRGVVDLLIPRGSKRLIQSVIDHAKVPVIETGAGICHIFVDESANLKMAQEIIINGKCQRPSVCNAIETVLFHHNLKPEFILQILTELSQHQIEIMGDETICRLYPSAHLAAETSWSTEYNDLKINCKIVTDTSEAINHIETFGTHHSDCIISENQNNVNQFMNEVDSACVYHNASTRFSDGYLFGFGAEIGISTQKLHARGPMGLQALTTYSYHLKGHGEIR